MRNDTSTIKIENEKLKFKFLEQKMKEIVGIKELNLDILKTLNLYENKKFTIAAELFADNNNRKFSGIDIVVLGENIAGKNRNRILFRKNIEKKSILEQYFEVISIFDSIRITLPMIKTVLSNLVNREVKVFEILKKYEKLSRKEIEYLSGYSKSKVIRSVNGLIEKRIVEQVGKGRSVKYQLKKWYENYFFYKNISI